MPVSYLAVVPPLSAIQQNDIAQSVNGQPNEHPLSLPLPNTLRRGKMRGPDGAVATYILEHGTVRFMNEPDVDHHVYLSR